MLYDAYELHRTLLNSASNWAAIGAQLLSNPALPMGYFGTGPIMASALQVFANFYEERGKPSFNIARVTVDGVDCPVTESVVLEKPFGSLLMGGMQIQAGFSILPIEREWMLAATALESTCAIMLVRQKVFHAHYQERAKAAALAWDRTLKFLATSLSS